MRSISFLQHFDVIHVDPDRLDALHDHLGEAAAEDVIVRALEEIAVRCARLDEARTVSDTGRIQSISRSISAIADQVGLITLARVARDVASCAAWADGPALAATLSRFSRVADRSLTAVWDFEGQSI